MSWKTLRRFSSVAASTTEFNVVSNETLKEAQVEPQKHSDLIVRVAGYSTYFTILTPAVQNEIIKRTENNL